MPLAKSQLPCTVWGLETLLDSFVLPSSGVATSVINDFWHLQWVGRSCPSLVTILQDSNITSGLGQHSIKPLVLWQPQSHRVMQHFPSAAGNRGSTMHHFFSLKYRYSCWAIWQSEQGARACTGCRLFGDTQFVRPSISKGRGTAFMLKHLLYL